MWRYLKKAWQSWWRMTDAQVEERYVFIGAAVGCRLSYRYMGEPVGFEALLAKFADWEQQYAERGFRPVPIDEFVGFAGWGTPFVSLGLKLDPEEVPIMHAAEILQARRQRGPLLMYPEIQQLVTGEQREPVLIEMKS